MTDRTRATLQSVGLLVLRVGASALLASQHGWGKLVSFPEKMHKFSDPLHVSRPVSLALTILGEFVAPIFVALGLGTRIAAFFPAFAMAVAAVIVHSGDPLSDREASLTYLVPFLAIVLMGGGRFSIDAKIAGRTKAPKPAKKPKS